ncbi:NAD(P)-binding protein [Teratosphaeria nubilosa]|uniref:NAD(P)-binding protein n=1 Tax=Teratosphaeria nubilosa TaxID=161662 RepID=A0A6G1LME6_9PEZI|nr:NAD(P)-binding protein [Teratosphaeria nubilosa]
MAPIRIAFIGLSVNRGWATIAHLPYLQQTKKYKITAVLNSSTESSEAAIKKYELHDAKAYGSAEELAADADAFDLAICAVRVDMHYAAIKPIVAKGKQAYVEWPLGKNLQEAQELNDIAKQAGGPKTVVGLQARRSPVVNKVRELITDGAVGKVLSSTVQSSAGNFGQVEPERVGRLMGTASIGATMLNIHFGHLIDFVLYGLGEEMKDLTGLISTQRPTVQLKHDDGKLEDFSKTSPDQIMLQGHLQGGGMISVHQRGGGPFKDTPGLVWRIYGQKGEIEVTSDGSFLQIGYANMTIKLHDHEKDTVETIDWAVKDAEASLPQPAQNVGRMYEVFADGRTDGYADWSQAVQRHLLLEKIEESSRTGKSVTLQQTMKDQLSSIMSGGASLQKALFR